jgi:methionyl-tRNA synthetase
LAEQAFHEALERIWVVIRAANSYIDRQAPWTLRKTGPARMATVLYVLAEAIRRIALLTQPFMPDASAVILDQVAVPAGARNFAAFDRVLAAGTPLPTPQGVFPRHVETEEASA